MKYYLIDFDNVNTSKDLKAWDTFTEEYCIYLFYTQAKAKIDVPLANHGKSSIECVSVPEGKQSLDMHLVSVLGFLINKDKSGEFVIVSKDTDYDKIIQFWGNRENVKICKCSKIDPAGGKNQGKPEPKPEPKPKTKTETKTENKSEIKIENKSDAKAEQKQENATGEAAHKWDDFTLAKMDLNADIQKLLAKAGYKSPKTPKITQIVLQYFGEDKFQSNVHNELMKMYSNEEASDIYNNIKSLLKKYSNVKKQPVSPDKNAASVSSKKEKPSEEIREILKTAGKDADTVNYVGNLYDAHFNEKDYKQVIYRSVISKFGQKQGLDVYSRIKNSL